MSEISDNLVDWAITEFTVHRKSTADMAARWRNHSEADFERALHIGLERRRVERWAERWADARGSNV